MLKEGQVRIPSGCAISGIFAKDGRKAVRRKRSSNPSLSCTTDATGWAAVLPDMESIRSIRISTRCTFFTTTWQARERCERFLDAAL